jgi:hypothetical protein
LRASAATLTNGHSRTPWFERLLKTKDPVFRTCTTCICDLCKRVLPCNIYYHFAFYGALHELNSNENEQMKILSCPQQCHAKYITLVLHCHACGGVLLFLMLCSRVIEYASGFLICQFRAKIVCHCKPHVFFFHNMNSNFRTRRMTMSKMKRATTNWMLQNLRARVVLVSFQ